MATLAQIAEQVIFKYSGGDASRDSELDPREVQLFVLQELNSILKVEYWNNIKLDEEHGLSGQYVVPFKFPVLFDSTRNETYVTLTNPYLTLGALDRGIQEVRPYNGSADAFIPMANGSHSLFKGTRAYNLENRIGYYPEGMNLYFLKDPRKKGISNVLVKQLVSIATAFISDPGTEADLVDRVFKRLSEMRPQDKINNNNPNQ